VRDHGFTPVFDRLIGGVEFVMRGHTYIVCRLR